MMELMRQWVDYHIGTMDASKPRDLIGKIDFIIDLLSISYINITYRQYESYMYIQYVQYTNRAYSNFKSL